MSFNLVIEVLLSSREPTVFQSSVLASPFQSRNRGSFEFKFTGRSSVWLRVASRFNLVIEVLLSSSLT